MTDSKNDYRERFEELLSLIGKEIRYLTDEESKLPYVIIRTETSGVFAGELAESDIENEYAILLNARRIWYWNGAATLSQLAMEGTSKPADCKFPCEVGKVELFRVKEILHVTEKARASIKAVPIWSA